jgi:hypothetical protein
MNKSKIIFYLYELTPEFKKTFNKLKRPMNLSFLDKTSFHKTFFHTRQTLMIL